MGDFRPRHKLKWHLSLSPPDAWVWHHYLVASLGWEDDQMEPPPAGHQLFLQHCHLCLPGESTDGRHQICNYFEWIKRNIWFSHYSKLLETCRHLHQDLSYDGILAGLPGAWLVKKICFICMQSHNFKKDLILKFKTILRTCFFFMIASTIYE